MRRALTALALASALLLVAGCGESEQEQAREVVQDYVDALNDQDFEAVCDLYSDQLKQELAIGENCAAFVQEQTSGTDSQLELVEVRVNGDRATADLDSVSEQEGPARIALQLERQDDTWRISGFQ